MQLIDGTIIVSATDLVGYLACDHLATLELGRMQGLWEKPHHREDPELLLLQERGDLHEKAYLERHRAAGRTIHEIETRNPRSPAELSAAEAETLDAMRRGVEVIYQATFFDGRWRGHADFLLRTERPSLLGAWSYDVADTKLARGVKAGAILQVCVYADRLAILQGVEPERLVIVTGDNVEHVQRLADYAAFYRTVKARFEARIFGTDAPTTYPDPVDHCRVCTWFPTCMDRRRADDHLSIVAGMSRTATERLKEGGIPTRRALAVLDPAVRIREMNPRPLARVREQARIQVEGEDRGRLLHELIEPDPEAPGHGLAALPEPSPQDLFFDIEADPWMGDAGLEYLLGVAWRTPDGGHDYRPIWGHDPAGEKAAFQAFIALVIERLERDPGMHVYHYAAYESGAIKRLMQRHQTCEDEVDRILRGQVLVDLYQVVRQGIRASVESYSIKKIEKFYMAGREGPVTEAGFSVVAYETWLRDHDDQHLRDLADYNRDDCVSTLLLRDWLEDRRRDGILIHGWDMPRPVVAPDQTAELTERQAATRAREDALIAGVDPDPLKRSPEEAGRWLLAGVLDWHRRDAKPAWWEYFRLKGLSDEDLLEESAALADVRHVRRVGEDPKATIERYAFPAGQDTKIHVGDDGWQDRDSGKSPGAVVALDQLAGTIDFRIGRRKGPPGHLNLIEPGPFRAKPLPEALAAVADHVIANGIGGPGRFRAVRDLLQGLPPRIAGVAPGESLRRPGEDVLDAAIRLARGLDESTIAIQGPPGTGKTWTGARQILALVADGRRVGVTAQSHKAITNVLTLLDEASREAGRHVRVLQRSDDETINAGLPDVVLAGKPDEVGPAMRAGRFDVAAGTAWQFGREDMAGAVDVLIVDEAGQLSLANVVAMGGSTKSIILLGDPNQLPQVSQGVHPDGAGASALEHVVGTAATIPPDRGLFLDITYRMHPRVNTFVSDAFYEGRLKTDASTGRQRIVATDGADELGLRFVPVDHPGDETSSGVEAEAVADEIGSLLGSEWTDARGHTRPLVLDDFLVVAPYNAHVAQIEHALDARFGSPGRVGTVDKFQGQEGAAAVYSMATSSPDEVPRGIEFLYNLNRFNVAVSRARGLSILVCSPELLRVRCRTPEQMRLANALCRYVEVAGGH